MSDEVFKTSSNRLALVDVCITRLLLEVLESAASAAALLVVPTLLRIALAVVALVLEKLFSFLKQVVHVDLVCLVYGNRGKEGEWDV